MNLRNKGTIVYERDENKIKNSEWNSINILNNFSSFNSSGILQPFLTSIQKFPVMLHLALIFINKKAKQAFLAMKREWEKKFFIIFPQHNVNWIAAISSAAIFPTDVTAVRLWTHTCADYTNFRSIIQTHKPRSPIINFRLLVVVWKASCSFIFIDWRKFFITKKRAGFSLFM
jgi:hypothetical protein